MTTNSLTSTKNAFKFQLQEQKYIEALKDADLKNLSVKMQDFNMNSMIYHDPPLSSNTNPNVNNNNEEEKNQEIFVAHRLDHSNSAIKLLVERYQREIKDLKSYIQKLNFEIRKSSLNSAINFPEIPIKNNSDEISNKLLYNVDGNIKKIFKDNNDEEYTKIIKKFNDLIDRFIAPDYLNPIFKIYEERIELIDKDNETLKAKIRSLESRLIDYVNENSNLRENNLLLKSELKKVLNTKVENNEGKIVYNEEYISQLEDRNNLLSRENELITINYQKITKEYFDFKTIFNSKFQECSAKLSQYNVLLSEYEEMSKAFLETKKNLELTEAKLFEVIEENERIQERLEDLKFHRERLFNENEDLKSRLNFNSGK